MARSGWYCVSHVDAYDSRNRGGVTQMEFEANNTVAVAAQFAEGDVIELDTRTTAHISEKYSRIVREREQGCA